MLKTLLKTGLLLLLPAVVLAQVPQRVQIRELNTYEGGAPANLTQATLEAHPLTNVLTEFIAVNVTYPLNSGLASLSSGIPGRIHTFLVDTAAAGTGMDGQAMQIVASDLAVRQQIQGWNRGDIVRVVGRLTFFGPTGQFAPTAVEVLGNISDEGFERYAPLIEPTEVTLEELNVESETEGKFIANLANYTKYINRYVRVVNTRIVDRVEAATGRPWLYVGNGNSILYTTDTSLRFRNDRTAAGYADGYNWRRTSEGPYAPPPSGAIVNLSGFIVGNTFDPALVDLEAARSTYKITPWDDGVVWIGSNETAERFTPEGWPNDLVVLGFPPELTNFTVNTLAPKSHQAVNIGVTVTLPEEGVTLSSVNVIYNSGSGETTVPMVAGANNRYTYTFPLFPDGTTVIFRIEATDSEGTTGTYPNTTFVVSDAKIASIATINRTVGDVRASSPLVGLGVLEYDLTATVVADSADGFVLIQDSDAPWSGIALSNKFASVRGLQRGDIIHISAAEVRNRFGINFLTNLTFTKTGTNAQPDTLYPVLSTTAFATSNLGAPYYGMVAKFVNPTISTNQADAPNNDNGEWGIASLGANTLRVDDTFNVDSVFIRTNFTAAFNENVAVGTTLDHLIGAVYFSFSNPKLAIRRLADIQGPNITLPRRNFALLLPADAAAVQVQPTTTITVSWDETNDLDGDAVRYMWAVAANPTEGAPNFANPLAVVNSNNGGMEATLTLSNAAIEDLMTAIGMAKNESRTLAWTILATDGKDTVQTANWVNPAFIPVHRTVTLTKLTDTSLDDQIGMPTRYELNQNYPNPFNPTTSIRYALPATGKVRLVVYDMLGREVATLVDGIQSAGYYTVMLDAADYASGIYLYRLEAGSTTFTKKMTLIK